eukprot:TRINITY_DN54756_c0_g1_i1.p1 TRINITY_DN54756_c0_g1~~TRINITY_DN54756_c0_g1_i1.p1  ORF type:complete len:308 (-),score=4.32 TRINITY_DN54756_c0_g1_i1:117-1040(-)
MGCCQSDQVQSVTIIPPASPHRDSDAPDFLESVKILDKIGKGASGSTCYKCLMGYRPGVVKILVKSPTTLPHHIDNLMHEQKIMKALGTHPNVVQYIHFAETEGQHGTELRLYMEQCDCSLQRLVQDRNSEERPFTMQELLAVAKDIAQGLQHVHNHKVMHRDLSSDNILVMLEPGDELKIARAKVGDFDSAVLWEEHPPCTPTTTPNYMSPEMWQATTEDVQYTAAADVWSFGGILVELCTLQRPWGEDAMLPKLEENALAGKLPPMPEMVDSKYPGMKALIQQCLQVKPEDRPTIAEVLRTLSSL